MVHLNCENSFWNDIWDGNREEKLHDMEMVFTLCVVVLSSLLFLASSSLPRISWVWWRSIYTNIPCHRFFFLCCSATWTEATTTQCFLNMTRLTFKWMHFHSMKLLGRTRTHTKCNKTHYALYRAIQSTYKTNNNKKLKFRLDFFVPCIGVFIFLFGALALFLLLLILLFGKLIFMLQQTT